jgi:hypothetical protein
MVVCFAALALYDDVAWHDLNRRWVAQARERGAVTSPAAGPHVPQRSTTWPRAASRTLRPAVAEGRALVVATGDRVQLNALDDAELQVLAWRGREAAARALGAQVLRNCADKGDALTMRVAHGALAVLELSLATTSQRYVTGSGLRGRAGNDQGFRSGPGRGGGPLRRPEAAAAVLQAFSPRVRPAGQSTPS